MCRCKWSDLLRVRQIQPTNRTGDRTMFTKTKIAFAAALMVGAASAALASDHEDQSGGFKIGPLGQPMGGPSEWGASGAYSGRVAYGFLPRIRTPASPHAKAKSGY